MDRSLGARTVAAVLRSSGYEVVVHDDCFALDTADDVWLREAGKRGWVVLSKDDYIRQGAKIRDQSRRSAVAQFFKQWGGTNKKKVGRLLEGRTEEETPRTRNGDDASR